MLSRGRLIFIVLSLPVTIFIGGSILASTAGRQGDDGQDSLYKYLSLFTEVLGLVDRAYVDETELEKLMAGAFEGTVDALDPFSLYVPSDQVETYETTRAVGSRRSGLVVLKERGVAYAMTVEKGSPAHDSGIRRGDVISAIGGTSTREMPLLEIHTILAGPAGTRIELETIRRGIKEDLGFELQDYARPGVELEVKEGVPVLTFSGFDETTVTNVTVSLETLKDGATLPRVTEPDKLLIDLRSIAGGDVQAAYDVAALFTSGELGTLKGRDAVVETFTDDSEPRWQGRVVLLIDRGTQGPAEVLAHVLRQTIEATLVGSFSFGYSGRLAPVKLSNGSHLMITDAFYTGPDREPIRSALEPDVMVRELPALSGEKAPDEDAVLDKGLDVLLGEEEVEKKRAA